MQVQEHRCVLKGSTIARTYGGSQTFRVPSPREPTTFHMPCSSSSLRQALATMQPLRRCWEVELGMELVGLAEY
jgi:hypothetical protein